MPSITELLQRSSDGEAEAIGMIARGRTLLQDLPGDAPGMAR